MSWKLLLFLFLSHMLLEIFFFFISNSPFISFFNHVTRLFSPCPSSSSRLSRETTCPFRQVHNSVVTTPLSKLFAYNSFFLQLIPYSRKLWFPSNWGVEHNPAMSCQLFLSMIVAFYFYFLNKRSVLRRQCSDTNRNIKRLVYCRYG